MARKSTRVVELEEAILAACEVADNTDQSRAGLSEGLDNIRSILADAYGSEFDEDLADFTDEGSDESDEDGDDPEEE